MCFTTYYMFIVHIRGHSITMWRKKVGGRVSGKSTVGHLIKGIFVHSMGSMGSKLGKL